MHRHRLLQQMNRKNTFLVTHFARATLSMVKVGYFERHKQKKTTFFEGKMYLYFKERFCFWWVSQRNLPGLKYNLHLSRPVSDIQKAWEPALCQMAKWRLKWPTTSAKSKNRTFFCKRHHFRFLHTSTQFWFAFNNAHWHYNYLM